MLAVDESHHQYPIVFPKRHVEKMSLEEKVQALKMMQSFVRSWHKTHNVTITEMVIQGHHCFKLIPNENNPTTDVPDSSDAAG